MTPAEATARAPIQRRGPVAGATKVTAISQVMIEAKSVILKNVPAGKDQALALRLIAEAENVALGGIVYNGA